MGTIEHVVGREVLDSRGNPTVEVDVVLDSGARGRAIAPSGASTGRTRRSSYATGLPVRGQGRAQGRGHVNTEIADALLAGLDALDQRGVDRPDRPGRNPDKGRLGANAILAVSLAVAKAPPKSSRCPSTGPSAGPAPTCCPCPCSTC